MARPRGRALRTCGRGRGRIRQNLGDVSAKVVGTRCAFRIRSRSSLTRERTMIDISTTYMGLPLKSPLGCSASPLCESLDHLRRMEDSGAGMVVLSSLFEEQLRDAEERRGSCGPCACGDGCSGDAEDTMLGPHEYLEYLRKARAALEIPVVASLNGVTPGDWVHHARYMQEAGASAIELNLYAIPTDPDETSALIEARYREVVAEVVRKVTIPVAVKIGPSITAPVAFARRLDDAGAKGLVIFNRFYQPDFDIDRRQIVPRIALSQSSDLPMRLHWAAILFGHIKADLAMSGGVHSPADVIKCMMAGGRVAMMTSALISRGIEVISDVLLGMRAWMEIHEYESIRQIQGCMSLSSTTDPEVFERENYLKTLRSFSMRMLEA